MPSSRTASILLAGATLLLSACQAGASASVSATADPLGSAGVSERPQSDEPVSTPEPTPIPTPGAATISDGDWIVGTDVDPGTYRTRSAATLCYWERLSGFGGTLDEIIANRSGGGYQVVTIGTGDKGFSTSGCGEWSTDLAPVTSSPADPIIEDGIYIVGADASPGTWRNTGAGPFSCYTARLSGFGGTLDEVISNDLSSEGSVVVTIGASDTGFETTGCGTWTKVD